MGMSTKDFWRLTVQSHVLTPDQGKLLARKFAQVRGAGAVDDGKVLSEWLVSENAISRYQATVLLAGRPGPFQYGDYMVYDRISGGPLTGMFRAVHTATRHHVLLAFVAGDDAKDARRWASLAANAQAWSRTAHPNLARVFEIAATQRITTQAAAGHLAEERIRSMQGLRSHHWGRFIHR